MLIVLSMLLFINIRNGHDWGDDFAQYLIQAGNIVRGNPQTLNGLVQTSDKFAVPAYPAGFPLLISPVYAISGYEIAPYLILLSLLLIWLSILVFRYYTFYLPAGLSFFMLMFFAFHPSTLDLKAQILSEIPFTLLLTGLFLLCRKPDFSLRHLILAGIFTGILASIRIAGLLMIPALTIYLLLNFNKAGNRSTAMLMTKNILTYILSCAALFFLINSILFPVPLRGISGFYSSAASVNEMQFISNLNQYAAECQNIFRLPFVNGTLWKWLCAALIVSGYILRLVKLRAIPEWFFLFYLLLLGAYPYSSGGFRFLFPVSPLLILYLIEGIRFYTGLISRNKVNTAAGIMMLVLFFPHLNSYALIWNERNILPDGPQSPEAKEMFGYIRNNTGKDDVIVFPRARAMALYGERKTSYLIRNYSLAGNTGLFRRINVSVVVRSKKENSDPLKDPLLNEYLDHNKSAYSLVWENERFEVYRKKLP